VKTLANTQNKDKVRVLIVEDEFILAINLQESLESLGYTVLDIADSAAAAIEKASQLSPNLILMDIRLRGEMDGIQAAEYIWNHLQIPIIYITGHSDKSTVERATLTSPFGYILKPIKEQELYVAITTALERYEREQFFTTVLHEMGDGVIVVDSQLHIKYLNRVAEYLTGWRLDEAKGKMITEVVKLIDEKTQQPVDNRIILALEKETTVYLDNRVLLCAKDGRVIPIADSATPIRDNNRVITGSVMVFRDDTQRRLLEERNLADERARQLEIQMQELQRLNKLKEDFLATTSHELRTPLSNIKMAICTLENVLNRQNILDLGVLATSATVTQSLNILRDECERELNLVDDLLNIRMIDANIYPLELISIPMQDFLPHIVESFENLAQDRQQNLQVSVSPELPNITSDLPGLTRIVSELINNACKYTPQDEEIRITAELVKTTPSTTYEENQYWQITISNSGVKIPIREQSRIFEPFYRIPHHDPWQNGGTGLGLTLVRKLVEYLQGKIEVTSTQGWTSFTVQLPVNISNPHSTTKSHTVSNYKNL
jgi:PAS domain S-box-containing protein